MLFEYYIARKGLDSYKEKYEGSSSIEGKMEMPEMKAIALNVILFAVMFAILFFAVHRAILCNKKPMGQVIHVLLAVFFSVPYIVLSLIFEGKCKN